MNNNVNVINYYNNYTIRQKSVGVNERHKAIMAKAIGLGLKKHQKVLEIGCGIGTLSSLILKYLSKKGSLTAYDISDKSIEIAKNRFSNYKNAEFICADITNTSIDHVFDVIIMPDVIEHIPIESHPILFQNISNVLKSDGFVLINVPDPDYLKWCHIYKKEVLQIIDQPIFPEILIESIRNTNIKIVELKSYSIWLKENDYMFYVLKLIPGDFQEKPYKPSLLDKLKFKMKKYGR